jgi:pimeloyl-ACP methyl ester carboxylesterase
MSAVVLVHGAWGESWCWERVVPLLEWRGVRAVAVDLPTVGARPDAECSLAADAAVVTRVLDGGEGPFLVCGHSCADCDAETRANAIAGADLEARGFSR